MRSRIYESFLHYSHNPLSLVVADLVGVGSKGPSTDEPSCSKVDMCWSGPDPYNVTKQHMTNETIHICEL